MTDPTKLALLAGQSKLTLHHYQRLAYVYVRQSTAKQVERNRQSQDNQYQLVERAKTLGWSIERIRIIDMDQAHSAATSSHRTGFKDLVAEVSLGLVGIIFGWEVSRLARNNSDWYHLLDLAALFKTLIADNDGIYDPRLYNDRLLLGLKGTMSEAELYLIRQRMDAGRLNQIHKGTYRQCLPTGLVRLPDGTAVKDPDDGIRHTIELVFQQFAEKGSSWKVAKALKQAGVLLPRRQTGGFFRGQLLWKPVTEAAVYEILQNPAYAGAFVYGRRPGDPVRKQITGRAVQIRKPMEEWINIQQNIYPAYISWEQYLSNQEQLRHNASNFSRKTLGAQGISRQGQALLQGLLVCGKCGGRMRVSYKDTPRYFCNQKFKNMAGPSCLSVSAAAVEEAVVQTFFEAIRPAQIDALEAVLVAQEKERKELFRHWDEKLKRAQYEAQLAERQYRLVDPENRLVAGELEKRWESALITLNETQEGYRRFEIDHQPTTLPAELKEQFSRISESLPELWQSGQLDNAQKKDLLRSLVARVIVDRLKSDNLELRMVWISGHYTNLSINPPIHRTKDLANYEELAERLQVLWKAGLTEEEIAEQVSREGYHSARAKRVSVASVKDIRFEYLKQHPEELNLKTMSLGDYLSVQDLAAREGFSPTWIYRQIENKRIKAEYLKKHPRRHSYLIEDNAELIAQLREYWTRKESWLAKRPNRIQEPFLAF